jgi:PQQ-dependent dehydrogenase (methanol/ethanol family)
MKPIPLFLLFSAQALLATPQTPQAIPSAVLAGRVVFQKFCAGCHGENARGGRGPDLTTGNWRHGGSDDDLTRNIVKGIAGTQMPAFSLAEADVKAIVTFLRWAQGQREQEPITGDAHAGRQLFFGKGQCSHCHMLAGQGGRLGPDLSDIKNAANFGELRKAITNPSERLRDNFETYEVEFKDGKVVRGAARNIDTFSIQLMDEQERIHLLLRNNLKRLSRTQVSLMPQMKLASSEIEDLIAFLLKRSPDTQGAAATRWTPSSDLNVSYARLTRAQQEPRNWLTYWGDFQGTHCSRLSEITPKNVNQLRSMWTFQYGGSNVEATPIAVDGLLFVTGPLNSAAALDARTGRPIWRYIRRLPDDIHSQCTVMTNRGVAILGDRLFLATLDAHLVALDAKSGNVIWDVAVEDYQKGFSITHAPLAIDGKIIVGATTGECGLVGFVDAFDAATGKKLWRFWAIPQKGDPARATWAGDSADFGGAPTWMTGTYDVETDTLFWTTGNPAPDYDGTVRAGENLYSCSVLALDPNSGKLKWYFQFTPHDTHDWDANETPVLIDGTVLGKRRKLLIQANRNGFYYALDRLTGKFLLGKALAKQTWADGLDAAGKPIVKPNTDPTPEGNYVCPDASGSTNWASPSYDPQTGLFYVAIREACALYTRETKTPKPGEPYTGGDPKVDSKAGTPGFVRALDPLTGNMRWEFPLEIGSSAAGVLSTGGGVLFAASHDGYLIALDARNGRELWHYQTGSQIQSSPISYEVDGKQVIAISTSSSLVTFTLP